MAMISCPECKKEISSFAKICPHCGCPICSSETRLLLNFSSVDKSIFPLYVEVNDETYTINIENVFVPPRYTLIKTKSILPSFWVTVYTEEVEDDFGNPEGTVKVISGIENVIDVEIETVCDTVNDFYASRFILKRHN